MSKINTLLVTGQNNHDWSRSSPFCKELLEATGKFAVTVSEDPSSALEDADALKGYDLIFSDYNGPDWSDAAKANFVAAVAGGTGLVILHAADNAFEGWVEFEKMCALLWRKGAGHGAYHEFEVKIVDKDHPITRGMSDFKLYDELYHNLIHLHGAEHHVLASAYSSPEQGGSGNVEPMMLTTQYGQGRVYHSVLGHVWEGGEMTTFENEAFQQTLVRGCEWAATGLVE